MNRFLPLILCSFLTASCLEAVTLHMEMTPELTGTNGLVMQEIDSKHTRFTIPCSTTNDVVGDPLYPPVRAGTLSVYDDDGLVLRCRVEPKKVGVGKFEYRFELADVVARRAVFTLNEFRDDGQVGGGKVYSFRLLNFIDPEHRQREMLKEIEKGRARMLQELKNIRIEAPTK